MVVVVEVLGFGREVEGAKFGKGGRGFVQV